MGDMQFDVDECIEYWCAELCWHNSSIFKYDKYKEQKHFSKNRGGEKTKASGSWDSNVPYSVSVNNCQYVQWIENF